MTYTPPTLTLSNAAFNLFLDLLSEEQITRRTDRITIHADAGDAIWHARGGSWLTTAPGDDTDRRFGARGPLQ
ncbi:MAG: hypothetical protein AAF230_03005 [Pseudomonadota bacterium]